MDEVYINSIDEALDDIIDLFYNNIVSKNAKSLKVSDYDEYEGGDLIILNQKNEYGSNRFKFRTSETFIH